ncbi:MAG: glycosyltransferase family 4 protein [Pirellulales bacterium]
METITPDQIQKPWRSKRYPALDVFLESYLLSRLAHPELHRFEAVFSHSLYFPSSRRIRRAHFFHATFQGLAKGCRECLDWKEYFVLAGVGGFFERISGSGCQNYAVSRQVQEECSLFHGFRNTGILYNALDTRHFRPHPDRAGNTSGFRGLVVGRLDKGKGSGLVRSLGSLLPESFKLTLAGRATIPVAWSGDRLALLGVVPYSHLPELYAGADYVLCPSRYEGFGMTAIEAWACAKPIISTNTGIVAELVETESSLRQLVVDDPDDTAAFAEKIQLLRENPGIGKRQAEWGLELVRQRFSISNMKSAYAEILETLL